MAFERQRSPRGFPAVLPGNRIPRVIFPGNAGLAGMTSDRASLSPPLRMSMIILVTVEP